jgi:hypothetical protein
MASGDLAQQWSRAQYPTYDWMTGIKGMKSGVKPFA